MSNRDGDAVLHGGLRGEAKDVVLRNVGDPRRFARFGAGRGAGDDGGGHEDGFVEVIAATAADGSRDARIVVRPGVGGHVPDVTIRHNGGYGRVRCGHFEHVAGNLFAVHGEDGELSGGKRIRIFEADGRVGLPTAVRDAADREREIRLARNDNTGRRHYRVALLRATGNVALRGADVRDTGFAANDEDAIMVVVADEGSGTVYISRYDSSSLSRRDGRSDHEAV